ncbi:MoxR-like ATPase [Sporocytophaga myxococcoides]|uniref:MoxR-like ATPase n=1 Tax=Sporocytophaga myxococcoides TaxID=153721 RepID=A0A098LLA4_9BACT|nr:MoxR family ATPase [Sporocytophaga myxococcoides]GAL87239.1 MoxR-like ATPase [Sporocytophaga myxococcoides]
MQNEMFENKIDLSVVASSIAKIKDEVRKVIVGQETMVELLLASILADGHVLIEGVPGVAKTLTSKVLARTISADFSRIQFTPDLMPSDVTGVSVFNQKTTEFDFKKGPIFSNIVLIDEINRAPAKTQAALFEVMEERQITVDGNTYLMDPPFMILATQNPIDQEGTYKLPEAQLDRFLFKIVVRYPQADEEFLILKDAHQNGSRSDLSKVTAVLSKLEIKEIREAVHKVHVEDHLIRYITSIIQETRNNASLYLGASPRASVAILRASKAIAAIRGRDFVTPEDIQEVTSPVLEHRVVVTAEKEMEGVTVSDVLKQIIKKIEVPR